MKLYLLQTKEILEKNIDSVIHSLQCYQEPTTVITDYDFPVLALDHVTMIKMDRDQLLNDLSEQTEPVFVGNSETIFVTEVFGDVVAAYNHWAKSEPLMIQLVAPNALFENVAPTMIFYGGGRMWTTGTRLFTNEEFVPVAYGNPQIIYNSIKQISGNPEFTDKIFHGGKTTLLTPLPAFAYNTQFGLPLKITSDAFDVEQYIQNIPSFTNYPL